MGLFRKLAAIVSVLFVISLLLSIGSIFSGYGIQSRVDMPSDGVAAPGGGDGAAAYVYALYDRYNVGEDVVLRLVNDHAGRMALISRMPLVIEKKDGDAWIAVYHGADSLSGLWLDENCYRQWTWDQRQDNGTPAGFGDYRAVINGRYSVAFTIAGDVPAVNLDDEAYGPLSVYAAFWEPQQFSAFKEAYENVNYSTDLRDRIAGEALSKASLKGADPEKLRRAFIATGLYAGNLEMLPCLADHIVYEGRPAWAIVYSWGMGGESLSHLRYYIVDDASNKVVRFETCR